MLHLSPSCLPITPPVVILLSLLPVLEEVRARRVLNVALQLHAVRVRRLRGPALALRLQGATPAPRAQRSLRKPGSRCAWVSLAPADPTSHHCTELKAGRGFIFTLFENGNL